jgi:D-alanyl-D-alanine carboxypeptidase
VLPPSATARFADADRITVRMLLNHTSGLAEYSDDAFDREVAANPLRRWTVSEVLDRSAATPRTSAPGERFAYNNTDYNLLGLIVERATGKSWRAAVRERIVEPLRLEHTTLPAPGRPESGPGLAHGYHPLDGKLVDLTRVDPSMAGAAGGHALWTSTADLGRFLRGLFAGRLFERAETLAEMRTFVTGDGADGRVGYGLGLERYVLPSGIEAIGHMGTTAGYRAFMFHLPKGKADIVMVNNSPVDPTPALMPALQLLAS